MSSNERRRRCAACKTYPHLLVEGLEVVERCWCGESRETHIVDCSSREEALTMLGIVKQLQRMGGWVFRD